MDWHGDEGDEEKPGLVLFTAHMLLAMMRDEDVAGLLEAGAWDGPTDIEFSLQVSVLHHGVFCRQAMDVHHGTKLHIC